MKNILHDIDWRNLPVAKMIGLGFLAVLFFTVAVWLIGFAFRSAFRGPQTFDSSMPPQMGVAYKSMPFEEMGGGGDVMGLSQRNIIYDQGYTPGADAEAFEITEYTGTIKTSNLDRVCGEIEVLRAHDYVIFENANRYERGCNYTFKVENEKAEEVLSVIEGLKPEDLTANTKTIKRQIDDYTNEIEILEKKLISVEQTLFDAQEAYDELTVLATRAQDVETLAKIIDSKINLIERLTQERINIKERIDRLNRSKAEQLDRLSFTFFRINVYEFLIIDGKALKDSWLAEAQSFVREFNKVIQDVTLNLAGYLLRLIQIAIYLLLALFVIKYGWRFVKRIWRY